MWFKSEACYWLTFQILDQYNANSELLEHCIPAVIRKIESTWWNDPETEFSILCFCTRTASSLVQSIFVISVVPVTYIYIFSKYILGADYVLVCRYNLVKLFSECLNKYGY